MQMAGNAEWPSEKTKIVCEIFAEQVEKGNRSSTHLNKVGYANVITKFHERTGLLYPKLKFKNKWGKLKREYEAWKKLKKQTGLGWDEKKGTVTCDDERWKKLKKDIKGCSKFEHQGLQNEEKLRIMFEDLRNTGADHWEASSGAASGSPQESDGAAEEEDGDEEETDEEVTPPPAKGKRARGSVKDKGKKPETSGREWLEEQMSQIMVMNHALDRDFRRCDRDPNYVPTIPQRYRKCAPSQSASDASTSQANDTNMDRFRDDLARAIAQSRG